MNDTLRTVRSRLAQTGTLVGALMLLMGTNNNNGCAPDPGGQGQCTTASDCTGDPHVNCVGSWTCTSGGECAWECGSQPAGCYGDQDCADGLVCNASEICLSPPGCQPGQPCPAVCYGYCVQPDPGPVGCYGDSECGAGQHCSTSDGACGPPPGCGAGHDCPAVCYGECVANQGSSCWSDQDCGYGERCNTWDYCGWPTDASGASGDSSSGDAARVACSGRCEPIAPSCQSNADCGPGEICGCGYPGMANGIVACMLQCIPDPNPQCDANNACDPGYACQNGVCVEAPKGCWSDGDCAAGEQCNTWDYCGIPAGCSGANCLVACQGMCEAKPSACQGDGDCGFNQHCEVMCSGMPCDCDPNSSDCACPVSCSGTCVDNGGQHCSSDTDCGKNEFCGCGSGPYALPNGIMCLMQCMPKPYDCSNDSDCASGRCNLQVCQDGGATPPAPACDATDPNCDAAKMPAPAGDCFGYCDPTPQYDCRSDADCASGVCELVVCEAYAADPMDPAAMPCLPDASGNCVQPPPPPQNCFGFCKEAPPQECGPNGECPAGYTCGCGWPSASGADPATGIACFPMCIPNGPPPCASDADCAHGQACVNGVCQAPSDTCQEDADCGANQHCQLGPCPMGPCTFDPATGQSWCPPCFGQCVDDNPGASCSNDAECTAGQYCAIDYCLTACRDCMPGSTCPPCEAHCYGTCQNQQWPQECNSDTDCDSGESCQCTPNPACPECDACFFQCLPTSNPGECSIDSDCGAGQVCDFVCAPCAQPADGSPVYCPCFGICRDKVDPTIPCNDDGTCPTGMACVASTCQPVDPPPASCTADSECADGYFCQQGPCAYFMPCRPGSGGCPGCGGTCQKKEPVPNPCMVTGCSGQVCAAAPVFTTCESNPQYACFHLASCGLNAAGTCGWQGNDAFAACMAQFPGGPTPP